MICVLVVKDNWNWAIQYRGTHFRCQMLWFRFSCCASITRELYSFSYSSSSKVVSVQVAWLPTWSGIFINFTKIVLLFCFSLGLLFRCCRGIWCFDPVQKVDLERGTAFDWFAFSWKSWSEVKLAATLAWRFAATNGSNLAANDMVIYSSSIHLFMRIYSEESVVDIDFVCSFWKGIG